MKEYKKTLHAAELTASDAAKQNISNGLGGEKTMNKNQPVDRLLLKIIKDFVNECRNEPEASTESKVVPETFLFAADTNLASSSCSPETRIKQLLQNAKRVDEKRRKKADSGGGVITAELHIRTQYCYDSFDTEHSDAFDEVAVAKLKERYAKVAYQLQKRMGSIKEPCLPRDRSKSDKVAEVQTKRVAQKEKWISDHLSK